ncbi:MAG TPA: hemolysin family protein [Candidatus Limnocylindria bacterium]|jgi:magnesium and cobalt exporter, CNNM family|nr:hemolysin family protein [Candidatus Limnocylindria bacterium]
MGPTEWFEVTLLIVCFLVSALASATETALTSIGRLRVRFLAEQGSKAAGILQRLRADPNRFLSTVLFTNTLALIVASTSTTLLTDALFVSWGVPGELHLVFALVVSFLLSVVLLIAAEVTPKTLAIRYAERVALAAAGPVDRLATFLGPVLWAVTIVSRALTGGRAARAPYLTEQELLTLLHVSEEQGVIEEQEHQMIHGIIEIGDKTVREIMVPRTDIVAVEKQATLKEIVKVFKEHRHTRLPVFEGNIDHVVGLIHTKDLLLFYTLTTTQKFDIEKILRAIKFTPEQKKVDELLHEMRTEKVHMMIVLDEYGGTAGLVSIEDVIEEIVGEIRDEYDSAEEEQLVVLSEHEARVEARFPLEELNSRLGLAIEESGDYDSVGGYVHAQLGKIASAGDSFKGGRATWTVEKVKGRRIEWVKLMADVPWPDETLINAGLKKPTHSDRNGAEPQAAEG